MLENEEGSRLAEGTVVRLSGFSGQDAYLNGKVATVDGWNPLGQYVIKLIFSDVWKSVKRTNLTVMSRLWDFTLKSGSKWLQWKGEQVCHFIDSEGSHLSTSPKTRVRTCLTLCLFVNLRLSVCINAQLTFCERVLFGNFRQLESELSCDHAIYSHFSDSSWGDCADAPLEAFDH